MRFKPGDVVRVSNGYELIDRTLDRFDIETDSVSNGLHNERASLTWPSFGVEPKLVRSGSAEVENCHYI